MSTSVKRSTSFIVTLVLKDGRQFIISDIRSFKSWIHSNECFSMLELNFFDGTEVDVCLSKIDRLNVSFLSDAEVVPFDFDLCDYDICQFADHIMLG